VAKQENHYTLSFIVTDISHPLLGAPVGFGVKPPLYGYMLYKVGE